MRTFLVPAAFAAVCLALSAPAQGIQVFGAKQGERACTTQILFAQQQNLAGGVAIEYGQPVWQESYDEMRDQLKGKLLRLGKDWWTTMTTSFDLDFGGTTVPAGSYLLGLHCDEKGAFSLTFLEATKGMKARALPFAMGPDGMNWKPDLTAALKLEEDVAEEAVEKLTMTLDLSEGIDNGSFTLEWGPHRLTAKVAVKLPG